MTDHEDNGSNPTFLRTFTYVFCKDKSHCCGKESRRDQFGNDLPEYSSCADANRTTKDYSFHWEARGYPEPGWEKQHLPPQ